MTIQESLIVIAKGVAASTGLGSAIVTAVNEYHQKALEEAVRLLSERVTQLGERISVERVHTHEFVDLFKNWCIIVQRTQHTEKLQAAGNILSNALLKEGDPEKLPYTELDHFTRCIETLSIGAIHVLRGAFDLAKLQRSGRKPDALQTTNAKLTVGELAGYLPSMDSNLLMGLIGELDAMHLLHSRGIPSVRFEDERQYHIYGVETTPLGFRFIEHILDQIPKPSPHDQPK
jgi:hypothetical protein